MATRRKKTTRRKATARKPKTKSEIFRLLSDDTGLTRKEISSVFEGVALIMKKELRGQSVFTVPGMVKVRVVKKPAPQSHDAPSSPPI